MHDRLPNFSAIAQTVQGLSARSKQSENPGYAHDKQITDTGCRAGLVSSLDTMVWYDP